LEAEGGPEGLAEEAGQEGAFNPETGEINWDCPCLGGMAHGPWYVYWCATEWPSIRMLIVTAVESSSKLPSVALCIQPPTPRELTASTSLRTCRHVSRQYAPLHLCL